MWHLQHKLCQKSFVKLNTGDNFKKAFLMCNLWPLQCDLSQNLSQYTDRSIDYAKKFYEIGHVTISKKCFWCILRCGDNLSTDNSSTDNSIARQLINQLIDQTHQQEPALLLGGYLAFSLPPLTQLCCQGESAVHFCCSWAVLRLLMNHSFIGSHCLARWS